ncbi:TonB-dependent receptor [Chitinivorax sp. B]|uniref:TonB-dependent receptor domain-containing protein n=1 Tax=Chitinivorax sp. B TaxID=2502235 RepID=UPI001484F571|nr:TonB-dependent receptor [Chitinivorax sp. B]
MSKPRSPRLSLKPLALSLTIVCIGQTQAQNDTMLDPVQITAERGSDTNTVVRAKRIEVEQAVSLQDLFNQTPEVSVGGGLPMTQKLYVRGLNERMLTVTIDGAAQPESAYHHTGQIMIEPELLKRVEVEAGTGAATAGPGALAGAVRFTTKRAEDMLRPGERAGALFKGGYQHAAKGKKYLGTVFGKLSDQVSLLASMSNLDTEEYQDGHGNKITNSATETRNDFVKLGLKPADGQRIELAHQRFEDEGLRNKRTNLIPGPKNGTERQRTERRSTTLNYDIATQNPLLSLHLLTFANDNNIRLNMSQPTAEKHGTHSRGIKLYNVSRIGNHKLTYGVDYRRDIGFSEVPGKSAEDDRVTVNSIFAQDDIAIGDQWLLGAGARYDRFKYSDGAGHQFESSGLSPSASVAFLPVEGLTLRLSHARSLRGVGVIEPFLKVHQPNADQIDPEKARNNEFSAKWQSGPVFVNGAVYQQHIDNYIAYDGGRRNVGHIRSKGYSLSGGFRTGQLSASLGMSHTKPRLNGKPFTDGEALLLGNSVGRTWVAQLDYDLPAQHVKLGWTSRLNERLKDVPADTASKAGYNVHDVYVQWQPTGKDDVSLTLTVNNLFDRYYVDQASFAGTGLPEPGRDVRLSLGWRI